MNKDHVDFVQCLIKGRIVEALTEELFKKLGFFVMRFGKENTVGPITQFENFIKNCGGKFRRERGDKEFIYPSDTIDNLPDFIIVNKEGIEEFVEIKFRYNACLQPKDHYFFKVYPHALMVVANLSVSEEILKTNEDESYKQEIKNSRFHIWSVERDEHGTVCGDSEELKKQVAPLMAWLKKEEGMDEKEVKEVIQTYEQILIDSIPPR